MQWHTLKPNTKAKPAKRVGRGGKRGKTAGRGTKGQKARSGNKRRPEMRDIIKKIPKARGYRFRNTRRHVDVVNLGLLETTFTDGETVTLASLIAKGLVRERGGKIPSVKILGDGVFAKRLTISGIPISTSAKVKIEKNGGTVAI